MVNWYFSRGLGKIAVPFFFAASGYLLAGHLHEKGWWYIIVLKRLRTLWLPMVIWCLLYYLWTNGVCPFLRNIVETRSFLTNISLFNNCRDIVLIAGIHPFAEPYLGVLWFVRMLFILVFFSPILVKMATLWGVAILYILQLFIGPELGGTPAPLKFTLLKGFFPIAGAAFFVFGIYLRKKECNLVISKLLAILGLLLSVVVIIIRGEPYGSYRAMVLNWCYTPILLVSIWSLCPSKRWPILLIKASFPVYVLHVFTIGFYMAAFKNFLAQMSEFKYMFLGLICFVTCVGLSWFIRKCMPRLSNVLFGGR